jgi:hypothetical protein
MHLVSQPPDYSICCGSPREPVWILVSFFLACPQHVGWRRAVGKQVALIALLTLQV